MAQTLASVNVRIGARIDELQKGLQKAERELLRSGRQLSRIGGDLTRSLTLPFAAAAGASLKFATDFESSFTKIKTLVGVTGQTLDNFKDGIADLSGPLGASQRELSDALFVITSAGERGESALKTLEQASKASAIGLGNTAEVARAAVAATQAYGAETLSTAAAVDKLTAIVREGNLAAEELAPVIGRVLPLAAQLGISFDEVGANIATFTRLGVSASESVTSLSGIMNALIKPSSEAQKEFAKLGISAADLRKQVSEQGLAATLQGLIKAYDGNVEALGKLFPEVRALAGVLGTAGAQGEEYLRIVDSIANSNEIVNKGFEEVSETAGFKLKRALVDLQNVGVSFGAALVPVVTDVLNAVRPLVTGFAELDPALQKVLISVGLIAASAGPAVSIFGSLQTLFGKTAIAARSLVGGLSIAAETLTSTRAAVAATGGTVSTFTGLASAAAAAWKSFNTVVKASVIGLAVTAVAALAFAVSDLIDKTSTAAKVTKTLADVNLEAEQNIIAERLAAERLIGVLRDETAAKGDKVKALAELNRISPAYFAGLDTEKSSVEQINAAYDKYVDNLLRAARAQAAQSKIIELEKRRLELENELREGSVKQSVASALSNLPGAAGLVAVPFADISNQIKQIEEQQKALAQVAQTANQANADLQNTANTVAAAPLSVPTFQAQTATISTSVEAPDLSPVTDEVDGLAVALQNLENAGVLIDARVESLSTKTPELATAFERTVNPLTLLGEQLDIIDNKAAVFGDSFDTAGTKLAAVNAALNQLLESGVSPYNAQVETLIDLQNQLNAEIEAGADPVDQLKAAYEELTPVQKSLVTAAEALGNSIVTATEDGIKSVGELASAVGNAARKAIAALIAEGVTAAISRALVNAPFPANLILAPIAGATAAALFQSAVPKFADGGVVYGPTFGLMGEYPGASNNPEVIAPLDKLKTLIGETGGGRVEVFGTLRGDDILLSSQRAGARNARRSG